jgi:hypothetical protein
MEPNVETSNTTFQCAKHATTVEEISKVFDSDEVCMKCPNLTYCNGIVSCKYAKVE